MTMTRSASQPSRSGFDILVSRQAAMQQWSCLKRLAEIGLNREAAAIVESFQGQMDSEALADAKAA